MGKHFGGRPSSYEPEYAEMILRYFDVKPYEVVYDETFYIRPDGTRGSLKERRPKVVANDLPTFSGFALEIGTHRTTLTAWATAKNADGSQKYPEFSDAYARARGRQENFIIQNGLYGGYNAGFAIMLMKSLFLRKNADREMPT